MKLESLQELLVEELQDLYSAEQQILKALPKMIDQSAASELRSAFNLHLEQTRRQVQRLDQIFDELPDVERDDKKCRGMEGIIKDGAEIVKSDSEPEVRDAGMIAAAQRVEHYEISGYGTARTYAQLLGHSNWANLLQQSLDEEKQTDRKLNALAERINVEAHAA
jgi:ferritin-like metal-binding protein YciE